MPKKGGRRRKTRTHEKPVPEGAAVQSDEDLAPRSIVAKVGKIDPFVTELILEMRKVMEPYTASNLRERSFNKMKDYVSVATQLGVSHLMFFSQTEANLIMRIIKHPEGPTLHFRLLHFYLPRQIKALQKKPFESVSAYQTPPVVVLNNFGQAEENHLKLMKITFQHMFPTINVKTVQLSNCRRVVLFHYNKESDTVEMRHYAIRANPVGISRNVKRIVQAKIPNLGKLQDISEYLEGGDYNAASDSEAEEDSSKVTLPERYVGRGNIKSQVSAMKLVEIGPRLTLELYKVQQGVNDGDILYHKFVQKTPEEAAAIKARVERERLLKEMRRKKQEENVQKKKTEKEEKQQRKKQRKEDKPQVKGSAGDEDDENDDEDKEEYDGDYGDEEDEEEDGEDEEQEE